MGVLSRSTFAPSAPDERAGQRRDAAPARREGYAGTDVPEEADVILINTCSVREKPEQKVRPLGRFRPIKEERKDVILGVTGYRPSKRPAVS